MRMRKLCPNLDREDGLDTVLEVPIPEEMFISAANTSRSGGGGGGGGGKTGCMSWVRSSHGDHQALPSPTGHGTELQLMLGVLGAPLVPLPIQSQHSISSGRIKEDPIEASMAKYIVQQYIAATGGKSALNSVTSMYAMGKVRMVASEFCNNTSSNNSRKASKCVTGEMGGFVLWQKKPALWCLELVVSGCKLSAGSDGRVAWRQTPWQQSHASRGPPRPLRRTIQGLDPRSTADLFCNAVCIGDKAAANGEDCFVLRLDAEPTTLRARSSGNVEIIRHTVWGYFSQRTGLLVQLDDSHLLRMRAANSDSVYWETTMESLIEDYRFIDGINIANSGRTSVSLFRFGETSDGHTRTRMEECWTVEEVDFNIQDLSMDCFLPPGDLKEEKEGCTVVVKKARPPVKVQAALVRLAPSKVAAVDINDDDDDDVLDSSEEEDENL